MFSDTGRGQNQIFGGGGGDGDGDGVGWGMSFLMYKSQESASTVFSVRTLKMAADLSSPITWGHISRGIF